MIPFVAQHPVDIWRLLTDRGSEYGGTVENHAFQLYLRIEGIEPTPTQADSPQTNGLCERFHQTMKHELYEVAFRRKVDPSLEALQQEGDQWLMDYKGYRSHSGKYCYGPTPLQTFWEAKHRATETSNERM